MKLLTNSQLTARVRTSAWTDFLTTTSSPTASWTLVKPVSLWPYLGSLADLNLLELGASRALTLVTEDMVKMSALYALAGIALPFGAWFT